MNLNAQDLQDGRGECSGRARAAWCSVDEAAATVPEGAGVEHGGYRVVQRLRAAGMGRPFIPAPDADVSELATLEPPAYAVDPFTGARDPVERAFHPDIALVRA